MFSIKKGLFFLKTNPRNFHKVTGAGNDKSFLLGLTTISWSDHKKLSDQVGTIFANNYQSGGHNSRTKQQTHRL